jgi:hypothetical protein
MRLMAVLLWTLLRVFALSGEALRAQDVPPITAASTDGLACSRFEWIADERSPKAAIKVPITINGSQYWYQMDTGSNLSVAYGAKPPAGWTPTTRTYMQKSFHVLRAPKVQFAGMSMSSVMMYPMTDMPDTGSLKGTVGLDMMVGRVFVIDFPKQRVCLMERADLSAGLDSVADWTTADLRNGKLYLRVKVSGKQLDKVFYDSGSSQDILETDLDIWQQLTGKTASKDATTHRPVQRWGKTLELVGAPATGDMILGDKHYPHPDITACPSIPRDFQEHYDGAQGLLGNAAFFNSIVILDLGAFPRFGVIAPQP